MKGFLTKKGKVWLGMVRPAESHAAQQRAEQGPCEPSEDFVSKFVEQ